VLGWVVDRFGTQGMIRIGIVTFGIGFILLSRIDTLAGFYGAFVVIALGSSLCGFFPVNVAIIHWFEKFRARALSTLIPGARLLIVEHVVAPGNEQDPAKFIDLEMMLITGGRERTKDEYVALLNAADLDCERALARAGFDSPGHRCGSWV